MTLVSSSATSETRVNRDRFNSDPRAASFGSVADAYERARPGYPLDTVLWLLGSCRRVLDLGAGTGKLTRQLVEAGFDVVAVEPSAEMIEQLRAVVPETESHAGTAEAIPLPDDHVDAVVAAQAFHWFDAPVALTEIARVLMSGGTLGLLWNIPDPEASWITRLSPLAGGLPTEPPDPAPAVGSAGGFSDLQVKIFRHEQVLARNELRTLVGSWSSFAAFPGPDREERLTAVGHLFDRVATRGTVVLPYVTYAYRARRL